MPRHAPLATAAALLALAAGCARVTGEQVAGPASPTASVASTCDGPAPTSPDTFTVPPTTDTSFWSTQASLDGVADRVTRIGAKFPQVYAGVALETDRGRLAVYRVPSTSFDQALREDLPGAPLRLVDAAHSHRELERLVQQVSADEAYWKKRNIAVNSLSPLADGSCTEVGTPDPARARPLFRERYGSAPIRLVHAEPVQMAPFTGRPATPRRAPSPAR